MIASNMSVPSQFLDLVFTLVTVENILSTTVLLTGVVRQARSQSPNYLKICFPGVFLYCNTPNQKEIASEGILPSNTVSSAHGKCSIFLYCSSIKFSLKLRR